MKNDIKVWEAIFKLQELKCSCGNNLKVLSIEQFEEKYFLLKVREEGKLKPEYHCLYDKEDKKVIPPGSFELDDGTARYIIDSWERIKNETAKNKVE